MCPIKSKSQRLEARVTSQDKDLVQRAAEMSGCSLSDFIANTVRSAAQQTLRDHYVLNLTTSGTANFVDALLNPPTPSERLRAKVREYRESVERM